MVDSPRGTGFNIPFPNWWREHLFSGVHRIANGTSFPSSPEAGQWFYRTDWERVCVYDGAAWMPAENYYKNVKGIGASDGQDTVFIQYDGVDIGAQVNAAFAAGARRVKIMDSGVLIATIVLPPYKILEFAEGAVISCSLDQTIIDATAADFSQIINPQIIGADNPLMALSRGIETASTVLNLEIIGGEISYCTNGIHGIGNGGSIRDTYVYDNYDSGVKIASGSGTLYRVVSQSNGVHGFDISGTASVIRGYGCSALLNDFCGWWFEDATKVMLFSCRAISNSQIVAGDFSGFYGNGSNFYLHECHSSGAGHKYGVEITVTCTRCLVSGGYYAVNTLGDWLNSSTTSAIVAYHSTRGFVIDNPLQMGGNIDLNAYSIINPKGIGGSAGKATVYAETFAGADIGAKVNTATAAGGKHVVVTANAVLTTPIVLPNDTILEMLPGVTISCATASITILTVGSRCRLIRPQLTCSANSIMIDVPAAAGETSIWDCKLIGSNNAAHTSNFGIRVNAATYYCKIIGGTIDQTGSYGIRGLGITGRLQDIIITSCKGAGYAYNALRCIFSGVQVNGCSVGFALWYVNNCEFHNCYAVGNSFQGYQIDAGSYNAFYKCIAYNNGVSAANVYPGFSLSTTSIHNTLDSCESRNTSGAYQKYGLQIGMGCIDNVIHAGCYHTNATDDWFPVNDPNNVYDVIHS